MNPSQFEHLEQLHNLRWYKGHLEKFWTDEDFKNLDYVKQDVTEEEKEIWISQGYHPDTSWTGSMYSNKNELPAFVEKFKEYFEKEFTNLTFTFYKMQTQDIMPEHVDHFRTYKKLFGVEEDQIVRILVMLEDWKPGHYLEINGMGMINWTAGDYFMWENNIPHAASNIGKLKDCIYSLQITATKKETFKFDKLYSFNIDPSIESTGEPEKYRVDRLRRAINHNYGRPYQVYTGNKRIEAYDNFILPQNIVDKLNREGLMIYLYEPICAYDVSVKDSPSKYTERYYSEFSENIDLNNIRSEELDSIIEFKDKNKLTNVWVHTCEYDINKYYPYYADKLKLVTDDIFLKTEHLQKPSRQKDCEDSRNFTHKFLSLSYRYTYHRHLLTCYLAKTNNALMSWVFKSDLKHVQKSIWHDFDSIDSKNSMVCNRLKDGLTILNERVPLNLDYAVAEPNLITDHYHKLVWPSGKNLVNPSVHTIERYYAKIFCEIVGETRFAQPSANFSEKVYRPMFYSRPFVVAAPPYTLQYMREQGYKTFGDFWDESYDTTECHEDRLMKIFEIIDHINNMSMDECIEMYEKMLPIIQHNFKQVRSVAMPFLHNK